MTSSNWEMEEPAFEEGRRLIRKHGDWTSYVEIDGDSLVIEIVDNSHGVEREEIPLSLIRWLEGKT